MGLRMLATSPEELGEAIDRSRRGDTILALPSAGPIPANARTAEISIVTINEAITTTVEIARWALAFYRSIPS